MGTFSFETKGGLFFLYSALGFALFTHNVAVAGEVGSTSSALRFGQIDANTPTANAVARLTFRALNEQGRIISGVCSGTLIQPDVVLTAGHCFAGSLRGAQQGDALPQCADWQTPGRWYPFTTGPQYRVTAGFGNDSSRFAFTTSADQYNMPGCADMMIIKLTRPVPANIAKPVSVLTSIGAAAGTGDAKHYFAGKPLVITGWGRTETGELPTLRRVEQASYKQHSSQKLWVVGRGRAATDGGDSGGPLIWNNGSTRYLVGVNQGFDNTGLRYTATFRTAVDGLPGVGEWVQRVVPSSVYCPNLRSTLRRGIVPLLSYWSPARRSNLTTSDPVWAGCNGTVRSPDYRFTRTEGLIFDPAKPKPAGTVGLYGWYNGGDRKDNWTTTEHQARGARRESLSPGYAFARLHGYVFDPTKSRPASTIPLYRWYDATRKDNWTTTGHQSAGARGQGLSPQYRGPTLQGYVYPSITVTVGRR